MNAIILAGAKSGQIGTPETAGGYRAGLTVGGRTLLAQALAAVAGLPGLGRVILVGPKELLPPAYAGIVTEVIPPEGDLAENLRRGLVVLPPEEKVLVVASDLPLLTQAALQDFVQSCGQAQAEIYYPVIRREVYQEAYPGSVRTFLSVRDGVFTGGNAVILTPAAFFRHERLIALAIAWRKRPLRLGRLLGLGFFLGLLCKRYTVAEIQDRTAARLGVRALAVESRFSEMGFDIDDQADLEWIEFYWGGTLEGKVRSDPEEEE